MPPLLPWARHVHLRQAAPGRLAVGEDKGVIDLDAIIDRLAGLGDRGGPALEHVWSRWQGMNRIDIVTETIPLRRRLESTHQGCLT